MIRRFNNTGFWSPMATVFVVLAVAQPLTREARAATIVHLTCGAGKVGATTGCIRSEKDETGDVSTADAVLRVDSQGRIDGVTAASSPAPTVVAQAGPAPAAIPEPAPAPAAAAPAIPDDDENEGDATYHTRSTYLAPGDLSKIFRGEVRIATVPNNSYSFREAYLEGQIFKDCAKGDYFRFEEYSGSREKGDEKVHGFMIADQDGAGAACMARHRKKGHVCTPDSCVPIRQLGAAINASHVSEGEFKYCFPSESGAIQCEDLGDRVEHRSRNWYAAQRRQQAVSGRASRKQHLMRTVSHCLTNNDEDRVIGRRALETLSDLGEDMASWKKRYDNKDSEKGFADLKKLVEKGDDEDIDDVMDKLSSFAADHPEKVERIAELFYELALRQIKKKGANVEDYQNADRIIAEAEKLDGLHNATREKFEGYHTDIKVALLQALAASGGGIGGMSPTFWPLWQSTMQQLQGRVMESCYGSMGNGSIMSAGLGGSAFAGAGIGNNGLGGLNSLGSLNAAFGDASGCTGAMTALQTARSIPQQAQQAQAQRFQFLQQMQAQLTLPTFNQYGNMLGSATMGLPGTTPMLGANAMPVMGGSFLH